MRDIDLYQLLLEIVANFDRLHGLEFDCNQDNSQRYETPHRLQFKFHVVTIAINVLASLNMLLFCEKLQFLKVLNMFPSTAKDQR